MKALFVVGIFLMFGGIVVAASSPRPKSGDANITSDNGMSSKIVTYSVFGGFILVLISWVASLKGQTN